MTSVQDCYGVNQFRLHDDPIVRVSRNAASIFYFGFLVLFSKSFFEILMAREIDLSRELSR